MELDVPTRRLRLRLPKTEDAVTIFEQHRSAEMKYWYPLRPFSSVKTAELAVEDWAKNFAEGRLPWSVMVEKVEDGRVIGDLTFDRGKNLSGEAEIRGYFCIFSAEANLGYASEALSAILAQRGKVFGEPRIFARILRGNRAAVRVVEKCGFEFLREEFGTDDDFYGDGVLVFCKTL